MKRRQELLRSCWQVSLSNEKWDRSEDLFCPFSAPRFRKWLRGRDLNPRPLGYEDYTTLACLFLSITYLFVGSWCWPLLARFCCLIAVRFRKPLDSSMR